jgi:GntR family transcriptional regulator/MocR family aminotransferase
MRRLYGQRRTVLVESLGAAFGDQCKILGDAAGMHLAMRTSDGALAERAARAQVQVVSTRDYYLHKPRRDEFVFGFSALTERSIREGVRRLAKA